MGTAGERGRRKRKRAQIQFFASNLARTQCADRSAACTHPERTPFRLCAKGDAHERFHTCLPSAGPRRCLPRAHDTADDGKPTAGRAWTSDRHARVPRPRWRRAPVWRPSNRTATRRGGPGGSLWPAQAAFGHAAWLLAAATRCDWFEAAPHTLRARNRTQATGRCEYTQRCRPAPPSAHRKLQNQLRRRARSICVGRAADEQGLPAPHASPCSAWQPPFAPSRPASSWRRSSAACSAWTRRRSASFLLVRQPKIDSQRPTDSRPNGQASGSPHRGLVAADARACQQGM